jgi:hypothetical protein
MGHEPPFCFLFLVLLRNPKILGKENEHPEDFFLFLRDVFLLKRLRVLTMFIIYKIIFYQNRFFFSNIFYQFS